MMHHTGPISGIASFGAYIATTGYDNQVILWDAATHTALARSFHDHLANQCAFSPDGRLLVTASSDYTARLWEVPGMRLRAVFAGHDDDVDMAAFSPDGSLVATCSLDRALRVFSLDGQCLQVFTGHTGDVLSVAWTPDGRHLISCGVDGTVRQWKVGADGEADGACRMIDMGGVRTDTLVVAHNGAIVAGDDQGRIAVIRDGSPHYTQAHRAGIKRLVYAPDLGLLASLSYDRSAAIWRLEDDGRLTALDRTELPAIVWPRSGAFAGSAELVFGTFGSVYAAYNWKTGQWRVNDVVPDACLNAVATSDGDVYTIGDAGVLHRNGEPAAALGSLCNFLLPFADTIVTGGQLGILFDARTGAVLYQHHSPLNCGASFIRGGKPHAAIGTYTGEALVFAQEADGRIAFVHSVKMFENAIKGLVADDCTLFAVCASTAIAWYDLRTLTPLHCIEHAHERIANGCCLVKGLGFASIGRDRKLRLWSAAGGGRCEVYETPHPNSVKCVSASADGRTIMTGSYGGTLAAFDVFTKTWKSFLRPTAAGISSLAYDAVRGRFLAAAYDGHVFVA